MNKEFTFRKRNYCRQIEQKKSFREKSSDSNMKQSHDRMRYMGDFICQLDSLC
jgi:hypothetical protein